jgi:hypothetical protein
MDIVASPTSSSHDFDFWFGSWRGHHRQLKARLAGSEDWIEFAGTAKAGPILGGLGNLDDNVIEKPNGSYHAASLRTFDPKTRLWSIWWFDGRTPAQIDPPMVGSFEDGTGIFYCDDQFEGKPIRVRFIWSRTNTGSPHWEQAFSPDGGRSWETNWVMDFTRVG